MTPSAAWTLADVIDFEHFLATGTPDAARDREWFDARIAPALGDTATHDRRRVFRAWLELQREQLDGAPTPGRRLQQGVAVLAAGFTLLGALGGAALAGSWLARAGEEPVNAPLFWAVTVGLQLLLLAFAVLGWSFRRRLASAGGGLHGAVQALMVGAAAAMRRLPGERRDALRATLARLAARRDRHGSLLALPAAVLAQRFGVAFNAGLLLAMLMLHLPLVDLRFGWQSTYPISAVQMHRAVQWAASPWQWALPRAQPDEIQVAATRYTRGQPAHTLPADAARAWWPFLVLSIGCYGLLLRGALWLALAKAQRRRIAGLAFDGPEAHALWRRLAGPLVRSDGGTAQLPSGAAAAAPRRPPRDCVVLVAQDVAADDRSVRDSLSSRFGCSPSAWHRVAIDDRTASAPALAELRAHQPPAAEVVIVAPAAREPIVAVALLLRAVLESAAPGADVLLLLTGADEARLAIWRRFVQIQRLPIGVEAWA